MIELKLKDQIIELDPDTDRYLGFLASMQQIKKKELVEKIIGKGKKKTQDVNKLLQDTAKKELDEHIKGSARLKKTKRARQKKKEEVKEEEKEATKEENNETDEEK